MIKFTRSHILHMVPLRRLLGFRILGILGLTSLASLLIGLVDLAMFRVLSDLVQRVPESAEAVGSQNVESLTRLTLLLVLIAASRSLGYFLIQLGQIYVRLYSALRIKLLCAYDFLKRSETRMPVLSRIYNLFGQVGEESTAFLFGAVALLSNGLQCLVLVGLMIYFAPLESLFSFLGMCVIALLVSGIARRTSEASKNLPFLHESLLRSLYRSCRNWLLLKMIKTEKLELDKLLGLLNLQWQASIRSSVWGILSPQLTSFLGVMVLIVALNLGATRWHTDKVIILYFFYLFYRFVQTATQLTRNLGTLTRSYPFVKVLADYVADFDPTQVDEAVSYSQSMRLRDLMSVQRGGHEPQTDPASSQVRPSPPCIVLNGVSFSYEQAEDPPLLTNVSWTIHPGQTVGMIGPSGVGKSTLLYLILGFLRPVSGEITVDGRTPRDYLGDPAIRVGFVGAEEYLIEGSLRENILYGNPGSFTDVQILEAMTAAELGDFVKAHPEGLDYSLTEAGEGMSSGQKQRLCLARALLSSPPLLILDEVSSNLDDRTEAAIAETLSKLKGKTTILIVSHRAGMIRFADSILDLDSSHQ